jgi:hypothetical protein
MMLRMLQPDLLCALAGFALGAAALMAHASIATPPPAPVRTDILAQTAQAAPETHGHHTG